MVLRSARPPTVDEGQHRGETTLSEQPDPGNRPRILRTLVFVPAYDEDVIVAAAEKGADTICLTLEDLTPAAHKDRARVIFQAMAKEVVARGVALMARPNGMDTGRCEGDLEAMLCPELHCLNIPKVQTPADVDAFCALLDRLEPAAGLAAGQVIVRPVVETALAIRRAFEIAGSSPRIAYMGGVAGGYWGDLGRTVGLTLTDDGKESFYLRSKVLLDVRAAGVPFPIGGGRTRQRDMASIRRFAEENKALGYTGSFCSHNPSAEVIAAVNEIFTPTVDEVAEWSGWTGHHRHAGVEAKLELARRVGVPGA
jgi:citrate lyase subunit beta/citryl-CoA lyase